MADKSSAMETPPVSGFSYVRSDDRKRVKVSVERALDLIATFEPKFVHSEILPRLRTWQKRLLHNKRIHLFLSSEEREIANKYIKSSDADDGGFGLDEFEYVDFGDDLALTDEEENNGVSCFDKYEQGVWVDTSNDFVVGYMFPLAKVFVNPDRFKDARRLENSVAIGIQSGFPQLAHGEKGKEEIHFIAKTTEIKLRAFSDELPYWPHNDDGTGERGRLIYGQQCRSSAVTAIPTKHGRKTRNQGKSVPVKRSKEAMNGGNVSTEERRAKRLQGSGEREKKASTVLPLRVHDAAARIGTSTLSFLEKETWASPKLQLEDDMLIESLQRRNGIDSNDAARIIRNHRMREHQSRLALIADLVASQDETNAATGAFQP